MSQTPATPEKAALILAAIAISLIAYVTLIHAKVINRVLGKTGIALLEKLMGLIVLVMGIQFIINALRVLALF
ncbi:MAG: MarC family protein [Candidatus Aenigmatarchaeota archaeon]